MTAKPTPRTAQTAMMTATLAPMAGRGGQQQRGHAERGQPGRERRPVPVAGDQAGATRYAATLDRVSAVVVRPAVPALAPAALAYSGTVDSSR